MKNWKTTLFGTLATVLIAVSTQFPEYADLLKSLGAVCVAVGLAFAKDGDVTGGTRTQIIAFLISLSFFSNAQSSDIAFSAIPSAGNSGAIQKSGFGGILTADSLCYKLDSKNVNVSLENRGAFLDSLVAAVQSPSFKGFTLAQGDSANLGQVFYIKSKGTVGLGGISNKKLFGLSVNPNGVTFVDSAGGINPVVSIKSNGVYFPSTVSSVNVTSVNYDSLNYETNGNYVTVTGYIQVQATLAATITSLNFTLPTSSNLNLPRKLTGLSIRNPALGLNNSGVLRWDGVATNEAQFNYYSDATDAGALVTYTISFTYEKD